MVLLQIYPFLGLLMVDPSTDKTGVVVGWMWLGAGFDGFGDC